MRQFLHTQSAHAGPRIPRREAPILAYLFRRQAYQRPQVTKRCEDALGRGGPMKLCVYTKALGGVGEPLLHDVEALT